MTRTTIKRLVCCACLPPLLAGCQENGLEKVIVSGEVTYRSEPVINGDILFYPVQGTQGPVSGASIQDGKYMAEGKGGVPVGTHRVQIQAYRAGRSRRAIPQEQAERLGMGGGTREQYLPARFNSQSEIQTVIESGNRRLVRDFYLED